MLAQQDTNIKKAITTVHRLCMDEEFRQQYEAREDRIRQQRDHDYWYDTEIKKRDEALAEKDAVISEKDAALSEKDAALSEKDAVISEKDAALSEKDARIAELERLLADKS
jgi:uncharacterized protein (DUF3084 family)